MDIGGGRVREPFLNQLARRLHLGAAMGAVERTEIDHQDGVASDAFGHVDVALDGDVALGMRHHRQHAGDAQLEQLVFDPGRHELRMHLEQERRAVAVDRDGVFAQPAVEHVIPEVLRAEAQLDRWSLRRDVS